jgi:hypothetical protein
MDGGQYFVMGGEIDGLLVKIAGPREERAEWPEPQAMINIVSISLITLWIITDSP